MKKLSELNPTEFNKLINKIFPNSKIIEISPGKHIKKRKIKNRQDKNQTLLFN